MLEPSGRSGPRWNDHAFTAGVFLASVAAVAAGVETKSRLTGRDRRD